MTNLDDLNIPKGQDGYLSKSAIAKILEDEYKVTFSASELKKIKRDELVDRIKQEAKHRVKQVEAIKRPKAKPAKKSGIKSALYKMFSKFF